MKNTTAEDPRIGKTHNRALCCECGALRVVSNRCHGALAYGGGHEGRDPSKYHGRRDGYASKMGAWWRLMDELKCETCGVKTRHAVLRDCCKPEHRDYAERYVQPTHVIAGRAEQALLDDLVAKMRHCGFVVEFIDRPSEDHCDLFLYGAEQTKFDGQWTIEINPNIPALLSYTMLRDKWENLLSDPKAIDREEWNENQAARYGEWVANENTIGWYAKHVMDSGGLEEVVSLWSAIAHDSDEVSA